MKIKKTKTLKEIKDIFNFVFPGLKIEFFKNTHKSFELSSQLLQYDENLKIEDINSNISKTELHFETTDTVEFIEQEFEKKFGLHVQIYRKSNDLWLQTSQSDDWTLDQQNQLALR